MKLAPLPMRERPVDARAAQMRASSTWARPPREDVPSAVIISSSAVHGPPASAGARRPTRRARSLRFTVRHAIVSAPGRQGQRHRRDPARAGELRPDRCRGRRPSRRRATAHSERARVRRSVLTGESVPAEKSAELVASPESRSTSPPAASWAPSCGPGSASASSSRRLPGRDSAPAAPTRLPLELRVQRRALRFIAHHPIRTSPEPRHGREAAPAGSAETASGGAPVGVYCGRCTTGGDGRVGGAAPSSPSVGASVLTRGPRSSQRTLDLLCRLGFGLRVVNGAVEMNRRGVERVRLKSSLPVSRRCARRRRGRSPPNPARSAASARPRLRSGRAQRAHVPPRCGGTDRRLGVPRVRCARPA